MENLKYAFLFVQVTPRSIGRLIVSVYDLCLDSEEPAKAEIRLTDIHSIHVIVPDKVRTRVSLLLSPVVFSWQTILLHDASIQIGCLCPDSSIRALDIAPKPDSTSIV